MLFLVPGGSESNLNRLVSRHWYEGEIAIHLINERLAKSVKVDINKLTRSAEIIVWIF